MRILIKLLHIMYVITGGDATVEALALYLDGTRGAFDLSHAHKYRSSRFAALCLLLLLTQSSYTYSCN